MKNSLLFALFILFGFNGTAQTADEILAKVVAKINAVNDYSVDANIKADIPLIKILPVNATIYFKQKDKFKVVSKGIAILPKQGFTDMNAFLAKKSAYMVVESGTKTVGEVKTTLLTVIPTGDDSEFVLAKLWIDTKKSLILKSQITTRSSGTVSVDYTYADQADFGLPSLLTFTEDVKKFKLPKSVAADLHDTDSKKKDSKSDDKSGTIVIKLTNYKVNKGINDAVFKEKN
jgi:outer membrane lipoprotein-sorting protein